MLTSSAKKLSGNLGCSGLEALWVAAGGAQVAAFVAAEIAMAESGGRQYAHSPTNDFGYWQINGVHGAMATYNPIGNAKAAIAISSNGRQLASVDHVRHRRLPRSLLAPEGSGPPSTPRRFGTMDTPDVLAWRDGYIEALDQTALPHQVRTLRITTVDQLVEAITTLAVRGAPVLGAAGALGVALAVRQGDREGWGQPPGWTPRSSGSPTPGRPPSTSAAR